MPGDSTPRSLVCFGYYLYNEYVAGVALGVDLLGINLWLTTQNDQLIYCLLNFLMRTGCLKLRR